MTLQKNWQFRTCYRNGQKIVSNYAVVFHYRVPDETDGPRVGVVASKRVGNAIRRNRAKRLLRVAARNIAHKLNDPDLWIVLIAKSSILERTSREVQDDIEQTLRERNLLSGDL